MNDRTKTEDGFFEGSEFVQAAESDDIEAMCRLGEFYEDKEDFSAAVKWYCLAEKGGERGAASSLACILQRKILYPDSDISYRELDDLIEYCRLLAEAGNPIAQETYAYCSLKGYHTEQNTAAAFEMAQKAMRTGDDVSGLAYAPYVLAVCYEKGTPVRSEKKALEFYQKSAEQCHLAAYYDVGRCYECGIGTSRDMCRAFQAYYRAAEISVQEAILAVARCYEHGIGVRQDADRAAKWFRKAQYMKRH